jgi:hypothetical protein
MKRLTWILVLVVVGSLIASAQTQSGRTPPEQLLVQDGSSVLMVVQYEGGEYLGLDEGGTNEGWKFTIDDWRLKHIKLTGVSTKTDFDGRHQIVVVEGKPDVIRDGIAYGKARYTVGHESKSRKVKVTWDVPPPKLTGLWVH